MIIHHLGATVYEYWPLYEECVDGIVANTCRHLVLWSSLVLLYSCVFHLSSVSLFVAFASVVSLFSAVKRISLTCGTRSSYSTCVFVCIDATAFLNTSYLTLVQRINVICFAWNLNTNWPDHRLQRSEKETRRFKYESFSIIRYVVCYCDLCNLLSDKIFQLTSKSTISSYFFPHKPELNSFFTSEKK